MLASLEGEAPALEVESLTHATVDAISSPIECSQVSKEGCPPMISPRDGRISPMGTLQPPQTATGIPPSFPLFDKFKSNRKRKNNLGSSS
jgi:hypothetical protein